MATLQSAPVWLLLTAVSCCIIITVAMPLFWGILIIQIIPGPELGPWYKDRERRHREIQVNDLAF